MEQEHVLKANKFYVKYIEDIPGLVNESCFKKMGNSTVYNVSKAPKSECEIEAIDAISNYGGWADFNRFLWQNLFFPPQNLTVKEGIKLPKLGEERPFQPLKIVMKVSVLREKNVIIRLPFQRVISNTIAVRPDLEKPQNQENQEEELIPNLRNVKKNFDWLKLITDNLFSVVEVPYYYPEGESGYTMKVFLKTGPVQVLTSMNNNLFLSSETFEVKTIFSQFHFHNFLTNINS